MTAATVIMPGQTTTKTKTTLWTVDCAPECGFTVTDHNQQSLTNAVQGHLKWVHPEKKMTEKDILAMAKKK